MMKLEEAEQQHGGWLMRGFFLLLVGCEAGGETIDMVEGTYMGFPADGEPDEGVSILDSDTVFEVRFFDQDRELWADIEIDGAIIIHGIKIEDDENTVEGVTVDGTDLTCALTVELFTFQIVGFFSSDFRRLAIDIDSIGSMSLDLVVEEEKEES